MRARRGIPARERVADVRLTGCFRGGKHEAAQGIYGRRGPAGGRQSGTLRMYAPRHAAHLRQGRQGRLRGQARPDRQRVDRSGQRDEPLHHELRGILFGQAAHLHAQRIGRGDLGLYRRQDRFRRLGLAAAGWRVRRRQAALRRDRRLEPAGGLRSDRDHLQRQIDRRDHPRRTHARQDFQRRHHPLGRPGHHRAERQQQPARRGHPRHLPQRRIGHQRQLPALPRQPPAAHGPRAPARPSTVASEPPPRATRARRKRSRRPRARSATTNGRMR